VSSGRSYVAEEIRKAVGEDAFDSLLKRVDILLDDAGNVELVTSDNQSHDILHRHYLNTIIQTVQNVLDSNATVTVTRGQKAWRSDANAIDPFIYNINPQYSFDNFIIGPSNRLAHAAAVAVARSPGKAYNPFFIHSSVGLGKTHLVQAICQELYAQNKVAKIDYLSCETFVNNFIHAVEQANLAAFRQTYRRLDVLIIDDVQFLSRKERTQEEFFHTFNTLYNAGKQIVLTSDSPPSEMSDLEERLLSRFKWGLVVPIEPPEYETRVAIIRRKSRIRGFPIPDDVIELLARNLETNIREIEGAIIKLSGYAALTGRAIDMDLALETFGIKNQNVRSVNMDDILNVVLARFDAKLSDLQSKKRTQSVVLPRQISMHLARKLTSHSLEEIGGFFGGRDHSTVLYADQKISADIKKDTRLANTINDLLSQIGTNSKKG